LFAQRVSITEHDHVTTNWRPHERRGLLDVPVAKPRRPAAPARVAEAVPAGVAEAEAEPSVLDRGPQTATGQEPSDRESAPASVAEPAAPPSPRRARPALPPPAWEAPRPRTAPAIPRARVSSVPAILRRPPVVRQRPDDHAMHRRGLRLELATVVVAAVLPPILWHDTILAVADNHRWQLGYVLTGWMPWTLMALGLLCFVPIVVHRLRDRRSRFHRSQPLAWHGWAVSLYLMGFLLATQVAQIAHLPQ
jgi:hypothetical protein